MISSETPPVAGRPAAVDVGGVEEVAAGLEEGVHDGEGGGFVGGPAELHGPEAEVGDGEVGGAEGAELHGEIVAGVRCEV